MKNRKSVKKQDFRPITVKNIVTGDTYVTCKAYGKKTIDGIEFTPVYYQKRLQLVRSDMLKKTAEETLDK